MATEYAELRVVHYPGGVKAYLEPVAAWVEGGESYRLRRLVRLEFRPGTPAAVKAAWGRAVGREYVEAYYPGRRGVPAEWLPVTGPARARALAARPA